ncbi:hypothetical protein HPT29_020925 [Microvirga terrae]|uniref:Asparagine synthetase domain-containing protein n=1 Tax=Microvirga terrae TaxID=2740529 RepID=A0ABY5RNU3_9HYPH|nr:hypothetical protein [Microvirga terrae]UVF18910.1 hypothetical protein HPT29_020925 [Microvirga terrae]
MPPPGFKAGPIFDNFFIEAANCVDSASSGELAVVILGTCVSTETDRGQTSSTSLDTDHNPLGEGPAEETPAQHLLRALLASTALFYDALDQYCGRHVIIFGPKDVPSVLGDATGMRTIFYAAEGGVVASHARLVEETLGGEIKRVTLPYRYGFPGNHTPYVRTRLLTANTLYDFAKGKVVRFWPRGRIREVAPQRAADIVCERVTTALKRIAAGRRVSLSITADLDSRTMLALALQAGIPFDGYTYDRGDRTSVDCELASELARIAGIAHVVVPTPSVAPPDLKRVINRTTYYNHHHSVVQPMQDHFADTDALTVTANLLEIGRFFYKGQWYADNLPDNPRSMTDMALAAIPNSARKASILQELRSDRLMHEYFADFIRDSDFNAARGILDPRDQFYWEHRMSAWHGMILLERDFYADCFIPFNSRSIFEALLGVSEPDRKSATAFRIIIGRCAPQLLSTIPINPARQSREQRRPKHVSDVLNWLKVQAQRAGNALRASN